MTAVPALPGFDYAPFLIPQANGKEFQLWEEVTYTARDGDSWMIPEGFRTDFATIPAIVSWAVPKLGAYTLAAIVHDLLCVGLNEWHAVGGHKMSEAVIRIGNTDRPTASSIDADRIFRRIALDHGTDPVTARLLWTGVRWGALFNAARREGFFTLANLLPFVGWSLAFAPVLVPATVLALAGRGVLCVARKVRGLFS